MRRLADVDLRLVRIFRAIAECQSLAGAELVLNLSQSRVSASLAELEARVGARLCRRGRAGFALTEAGKALYEASHELFEAVDRFCNRASRVAVNLKRVLRIGTVDAVVTNPVLPLPAALGALRRQHPSLVIDFAISGPEELERQLSVGARDLLIVPGANRRAEFDYVHLLDERQSLYCGEGHRLFHVPQTELERADLSHEPFIARGYLHHQDLKRIGHREAAATVEMMEAQLVLVLSGAFIGYLPAHYARAWVEQGRLRAIAEPRFSYDSSFYLVTQRGGAENPLVRLFRDLMVRRARERVQGAGGRQGQLAFEAPDHTGDRG